MKGAFIEVLFMGIAVTVGWFMCLAYTNSLNPAPVQLIPEVGEGKTFVVATNTVTWVHDPVEITKAFTKADEKEHAPAGLERTGLAVYNGERCTIYAYEPTDVNDRERMYVLGHELLHCFRGDYHK